MSTARDWGRRFYRKFSDDDAAGAAAEMAYRFMFALFPLLIFLAALSSYVARWLGIDNPTEEILEEAGTRLPSDVQSLLEPQLRSIFDNQSPGLLTVTALTAIWAGSSGTKTVMKVLNRVYEVEETRPFIRKQAMGVVLTVIGGLTFLVGAIVLVTGQAAGEEIADAIGLGDAWGVLMTYGQIPIVLLLITVGVSFVYWSAPNEDIPLRLVSWGAAVFVVLWLIATLGFGFYVANFGSYNATYGSLGAVIVLMTWLYLTALLLIVGAEVNVLAEGRLSEAQPEARAGAAGATRTDVSGDTAAQQSAAVDSMIRPREAPTTSGPPGSSGSPGSSGQDYARGD